MTSDINNCFEFDSCNRGIVRVGNNVTCHIKGIGSITLDGKTNTDDVYFVNGLKHNIRSVGQLIDKGYELKLTEKTIRIKPQT